jgi:MYXO-CTERM domain-containing protein
MTSLRILATGAASALAVGLAAPSQAAVALDGAVNQQATAGFTTSPFDTDTAQAAWTTVPQTLSVTAAAQGSGRGGLVDARSTVTAVWDSANSGTIDFENHGWSATASNPGPGDQFFSIETSAEAPDWTYAFTATEDGRFDFGFHLRSVATDAFGLGVWDLVFSSNSNAAEVIPFHGLGGSGNFDDTGSLSRDLAAGQNYRVSLVSHERLTATGDTQGRNVTEFANFNWAISGTDSAVPEPSAWALGLLGAGLAGAALRRRRDLAAAA